MAVSARLSELEDRLKQLRRYLLPRRLSPTGSYGARALDRARAYRVLAHAEIEACIEDLVRQFASREYAAWEMDRKPRTCLIALVGYYAEAEQPAVPEGVPPMLSAVTPGFLKERVQTARDAYMRKVATNNGVKEKDLLRLLLPVGIQEYELDRTWLSTMDSFGATRGETAHKSFKTQQPPDPASELATIEQILEGLRKVDARLASLVGN